MIFEINETGIIQTYYVDSHNEIVETNPLPLSKLDQILQAVKKTQLKIIHQQEPNTQDIKESK